MANLSSSTPQVTAVILADQSDQDLKKAVASVKWMDEVIVLWSGKLQDRPRQLGKAVQCISYHSPITDFAEARNYALESVKTEWVFFLDSDEVLDPSAQALIKTFMSEKKYGAVSVLRRDIFLGRELHHGEVGSVFIPRLFQCSKVKYERPVHEVPVVEGPVCQAHILVCHFAHRSISEFWSKITRYVVIDAQLRAREGQTVSWWQLVIWPTGKFIDNYFLKLGVLDGWPGLVYALLMSVHSFAVRALLYEHHLVTQS